MVISPIKTNKIKPGTIKLVELIDQYLPDIEENQIIVVTSKLVSLCENRVISQDSIDKEELIMQEADLFLPSDFSKYGYHFSIKNKTLVASAGIDESNGGDVYVLWPKDPQASANEIRKYIREKHNSSNIGVIITDSVSQPLRIGTTGVAIGYSGFKPINDYRGMNDLFGHEMKVTRSNVAGGLAAAAVVVMGEGSEQTPMCIIESVPFVEFCQKNPSKTELEEYFSSIEDDLFGPMINALPWKK